VLAQEPKVDPTWLHRSLPVTSGATTSVTPGHCDYHPIFGSDSDLGILRTVTQFGQVTVTAEGTCPPALYERQEEIYYVLSGNIGLRYAESTYPMRANDFTYLPPGVKHSIANASQETSRVLIMTFRIPPDTRIAPALVHPTIINLDNVKEQTVEGHPTSVLYKLLLGPRNAKRDAIDQAYVVTSFFWMNFAPGGTNDPHHHEGAEEIYVVMDGEGDIVAGSGINGIEGRYPAKAGDAYYFRPNCTVGFYNQNKPGARAHILAVRARIPAPAEND
jgi:mannose-6-phosphate isomerase-like protein (cupin superfamily)